MKKEKSEGILNPYNDKLKKAYLHGGGYIEIDGVEYSPDEYITMLEEANENLIRADKKKSDHIDELEKEIEELKRCWGIEIETCNRYRGKCEKLEEENKKLKMSLEEKDENGYSLAKENYELKKEIEELKSDLEECECSMHFENDEVGYRKRECKKLKEDVDYRHHRAMVAERGGEDED